MSHLKERSAKNCLNCNTQVEGRYCHVCGQENIEPSETVWHLITHFFNDITHFDGKFFSTLKYLIRRPGFLPAEYMIGKRARYLNPIRMYVFTSAIFFLIFFSLFNVDDRKIDLRYSGKTAAQIDAMDSATYAAFVKENLDGAYLNKEEFKRHIDSSPISSKGFHFTGKRYKSRAEYDSLIKAGVKKHNWIERTLIHKEIELNEKFNHDGRKVLASLISNLMHSFPQMLFISLPLFALVLHLLYRRKRFYFSNHLIFAVHLYIFTFIMLLLVVGFNRLRTALHWSWLVYPALVLYLYMFYYEYKAMRKFYGQSRGKTILKFILLNLALLAIIIILFTVFLFLSFFKI